MTQLTTTVYAMQDPGVYEERSLENPNLSLQDAGAWAEVFGDYTAMSGERITHRSALSLPAVMQAVQLISGDVAKLPLYVYRRNGDRQEIATDHPLYRILARQPSLTQPAYTYWKTVMLHALMYGHSYSIIQRGTMGRVEELLPVPPDRVSLLLGEDPLPLLYRIAIDGHEEFFQPSEILHIKNLMWSNSDLLKMIELARDTLGLSRASERYSSMFFKQGAQSGGIIEVPPGMKREARERLEASISAKHSGASKMFKFMVLRDGVKFHNTSIAPINAQLTEVRKDQVADVARMFNLPPRLLGLHSTSTYKSREEENRAYHDTTISHWLHAIRAECWHKLLPERDKRGDRYFLRHDLSELIQADIETIYQVGKTGIESGIVSPNEVREQLGMNPREGGDIYLTPLNMTTDPVQNDENSDDPPPEAPDARLNAAVIDVFVRDAAVILGAVHDAVKRAARRQRRAHFIRWIGRLDTSQTLVTERLRQAASAIGVILDRPADAIASLMVSRCTRKLQAESRRVVDQESELHFVSRVTELCDASRAELETLIRSWINGKN